MINSVTVFCASSTRVPSKYIEATQKIGLELAKNNIRVYYGAGAVGLMGTLADTVLSNNGEVFGIIPHFMKELEWAHLNLSNLVVVDNMPLRKQMLIDSGDAVLALPGGCGTLDELLEVITLKQLGQYKKPVVILNTDGFYDPLITMLEKMIEENFMRDTHRNIWTLIDTPDKLIPAFVSAPEWDENMIKIAQL